MYIESFDSPLGAITVEADDSFVTAVRFTRSSEQNPNAVTALAVKELIEYFNGERKSFTVRCSFGGTPFQNKVWSSLCDIPYGETASYSDIAKAVGSPRACRAVGCANNKNPVPIIVPCHRVIGKDGALVGYAGGIEIKQKLLQLENRYK
ncbi:MAG: methylated-DNA--[protein]-cysteine S-methyltransferase [Acutalibacteraceae bacterium]